MADNDQFIPEGTGRIGIGTPDAMWDAMRESAGIPLPPKDPPRGSLTEGRDISAAFTELIREHMACTFMLFGRAVHQRFGMEASRGHWRNMWLAFEREHKGLIASFRPDGGGNVYEATLQRALRTWTAVVPRIMTDEEARKWEERDRSFGDYREKTPEGLLATIAHEYQIHCIREGIKDPTGKGLRKFRAQHYDVPDATDAQLRKHFEGNPLPAWYRIGVTHDQYIVEGPDIEGLPYASKVIATSAKVSTEERHRLWIAEFAAEVELCVERFADSTELPREMARLIDAIRSFEVATGEARLFVEHLRTTGIGSDVLTTMRHSKDRLLHKLDEIAVNMTSGTETPLNGAPLFIWKGQPAELFVLFEELVGKGWVELPMNRGKRSRGQLARNVHSAFAYASGTNLKVGTAMNYLKKGRNDVNEQRPEPRVAFALKKNPDVGDSYDPDKAGE